MVASDTKVSGVDALLRRMEHAGRDPEANPISNSTGTRTFVERGVGGVSAGPPPESVRSLWAINDRIARVTDVVRATGAQVRALTFKHR